MTIEDRTALRERPARAAFQPEAISLISSDIPEGMTIAEYRRRRCAATPKLRGWRRAFGVVARTA